MDGRSFREARERAGLSLQELAQALDVREVYLQALEHGELGRLVGSSYVQSIAVRYAAAVGLDPEMVLAACDEESTAESSPADSGRTFAWAVGDRRSARPRLSARRVAVILLVVVVAAAAVVAVLQSLSIISLSATFGGGSADRTTTAAPSTSTSSTAAASMTTETSTTTTMFSTTTSTAAAEAFTIVFNPSADVWIEIDDGKTGDVIYSGMRKAGERLKLQFTAPAKVVVGKPEVIKVSFNGRVVKTPSALVWRLSLAGIAPAE